MSRILEPVEPAQLSLYVEGLAYEVADMVDAWCP